MLICFWYPSFLSFVVPYFSCSTHSTLCPTCFLCTLSHFNVFLYYNCLFLSTTSLSLAPSLSAPYPFAVCTHFHTLLFISAPFPFLFFLSFHPFPLSHALLSHTSFSVLRWESHNASEERRVAECHFYIVFTLPLLRT